MNFLLHRHLAERRVGSLAAGHGAMLPDLWRMADRRVRPNHEVLRDGAASTGTSTGTGTGTGTGGSDHGGDAVDREVAAGIAHHLAADDWFHASRLFTTGERRCLDRFREASFVAPRMGLLAHITWELCLDGALVRRQGLSAVLGPLRDGHEVAGAGPAERAAAVHHFDRVERTRDERDTFHSRMRAIGTRLLDGSWIGAYADPSGLTEVLGAIRRRLTLPALGERDRGLLTAALEDLSVSADGALDELLDTAP